MQPLLSFHSESRLSGAGILPAL